MDTHRTRFRVRYAETDAAEIVYYSNFFIYFEVGKMEMFRDLNLPYDRCLPMIEAHCDFKTPAYFDDLLEVQTTVPEVYEKGFKVYSKVYRVGKTKDKEDLTLLAEGYTVHLTADENRKVHKLPEEFIKAFGKPDKD